MKRLSFNPAFRYEIRKGFLTLKIFTDPDFRWSK